MDREKKEKKFVVIGDFPELKSWYRISVSARFLEIYEWLPTSVRTRFGDSLQNVAERILANTSSIEIDDYLIEEIKAPRKATRPDKPYQRDFEALAKAALRKPAPFYEFEKKTGGLPKDVKPLQTPTLAEEGYRFNNLPDLEPAGTRPVVGDLVVYLTSQGVAINNGIVGSIIGRKGQEDHVIRHTSKYIPTCMFLEKDMNGGQYRVLRRWADKLLPLEATVAAKPQSKTEATLEQLFEPVETLPKVGDSIYLNNLKFGVVVYLDECRREVKYKSPLGFINEIPELHFVAASNSGDIYRVLKRDKLIVDLNLPVASGVSRKPLNTLVT